jgi:hypothetical protein
MMYSCASGMHGECAIVLEICYNVEDGPNQTKQTKSNQIKSNAPSSRLVLVFASIEIVYR